MENTGSKLKFEYLAQELQKNVLRVTNESKKIRKNLAKIKFQMCLYAFLFITFVSFLFTQFSSHNDEFLSKKWIEFFLVNSLTVTIIISTIILSVIIYLKLFPMSYDSDDIKIDEFLNQKISCYSNLQSLSQRSDNIIKMIDVMIYVSCVVYMMFWFSLCKKDNDEKYINIKKAFLNDTSIPNAFKELFNDSEKELSNYNLEDEANIRKIEDYMIRDENILDTLTTLIHVQHLLEFNDLPSFIKKYNTEKKIEK